MKYVFTAAVVAAILSICSCGIKPAVKDNTSSVQKLTKPTPSGIVRLVNDSGRTFCSAFVISKSIALTATHCVISQGLLGIQVNSDVNVASEDGQLVIQGTVRSIGPRQDVAVVSGDFSKFTPLKFSTLPGDDILANTYNLTSCGYPYGGNLVCYSLAKPFKALDMVGFRDGQMYAAMSGGPILDLSTGIVYAVNHGVTVGAVIGAPLVSAFFGQLIIE